MLEVIARHRGVADDGTCHKGGMAEGVPSIAPRKNCSIQITSPFEENAPAASLTQNHFSAPICMCKRMQAHIHTEFRCCCFTRRCLKATGALLVLPRVHSQVYAIIRASAGGDLIKQPDQAKGFPQHILSSIVIAILRELIIRA